MQVISTSAPSAADYPRRFGWLMRVVLSLLVFNMVVGSLLVLTPYEDWVDQLALEWRPRKLPTRAELDRIAAGDDAKYSTAGERWAEVGKSAARFFVPWPTPETRQKLDEPLDYGKFAVAWITTRLQLVSDLAGIDQGWPMYSNAVTGDTLGRCRLLFADGTTEIYRIRNDPEDLTWFSHWNEKKVLAAELKIHREDEGRIGFCNYLSHRHAVNAAGSPLVKIEVYKVRYEYPPPGADAYEWLRQQTGPPPEQVRPVFWEYDVATKTGRSVK